MIIIFIN